MAGWATIQSIPFNTANVGNAFPAQPAGPGYDTGTGSFTAWGANNAILIPNTGSVILLYWCGATLAGTIDVLVGQSVGTTGQWLPAATMNYTIAASSYGWLGPWNANTFNIGNTSASFGTIAGSPGALPASATGCVAVAFTTITSLAVQARSIIPA